MHEHKVINTTQAPVDLETPSGIYQIPPGVPVTLRLLEALESDALPEGLHLLEE